MDEKSVCANIEKLVGLLNAELKAAHELKLKISLTGVGPIFRTGPPEVCVRVWREITLVNAPRYELDAIGPELSSGRGKVSMETKK